MSVTHSAAERAYTMPFDRRLDLGSKQETEYKVSITMVLRGYKSYQADDRNTITCFPRPVVCSHCCAWAQYFFPSNLAKKDCSGVR